MAKTNGLLEKNTEENKSSILGIFKQQRLANNSISTRGFQREIKKRIEIHDIPLPLFLLYLVILL